MSVCRCTDTEVCFPCRDREAHRGDFEPCDDCPNGDCCQVESKPDAPGLGPDAAGPSGVVTAADPALLVPGSEWRDPVDGEVVRLLRRVDDRDDRTWRVEVVQVGSTSVFVRVGNRCDRIIWHEWQRVSPPPAEAPAVEPATSQVSSSREVEPATDEQIAEWERLGLTYYWRGTNEAELVQPLIARIRQAEDRLALSRASRDNCHERGLAMRAERDEALAEAARLREQVERMRDVVEAAQNLVRAARLEYPHYAPDARTRDLDDAIRAFHAAEPTASEGGG